MLLGRICRKTNCIFENTRLQSKVILTVTAVLLTLPAIYFFFCEFADLPLGKRFLSSLFQSVTPRTAGFNTVDLTLISETGLMLMIILCLSASSPGSTAGGMKTTTIAVLFFCFVCIPQTGFSPLFWPENPGQLCQKCSHDSSYVYHTFPRRRNGH